MSEQTILAFDFGLKRMGVAVGQFITQSAKPLQALDANRGIPNWEKVDAYIKDWSPHALVVGIPTKMDGASLYVTAPAKQFAKKLEKRYSLPVHHADERLTTVEAREQLFQQGGYRRLQQSDIDSFAAKLILEGWFQQHGCS